jgi:hypothetical protein
VHLGFVASGGTVGNIYLYWAGRQQSFLTYSANGVTSSSSITPNWAVYVTNQTT